MARSGQHITNAQSHPIDCEHHTDLPCIGVKHLCLTDKRNSNRIQNQISTGKKQQESQLAEILYHTGLKSRSRNRCAKHHNCKNQEQASENCPQSHMGLQICFQDHGIDGTHITGIQKVPVSIGGNIIVHFLQVDFYGIRPLQSVFKPDLRPLSAAGISKVGLSGFSHSQDL